VQAFRATRDSCYPAAVIGDTLGNSRVIEELGEGGMGVVYLAEHLIGRKAAIEVLHEARSTAMLHHPGLVDVFDFGFGDHQTRTGMITPA
jgi:serine/threonine-protein kinase